MRLRNLSWKAIWSAVIAIVLLWLFVILLSYAIHYYIPSTIAIYIYWTLIILVGVVGGVAGFVQIVDILDRFGASNELSSVPSSDVPPNFYLDGLKLKWKTNAQIYVNLSASIVDRSLLVTEKIAAQIQPSMQQSERSTIADFVRKSRRLMIVGSAGAGKSTTLEYLINHTAELYLNHNGEGVHFPLWINLGYGENPENAYALLEFWWDEYGISGDATTYLKNHKLALFLDGLNEMSGDEDRISVKLNSLKRLLDEYPSMPVFVSCRTQDYIEGMDLGIPAILLAPLDKSGIGLLIDKVLGSGSDLWKKLKGYDDDDPLLKLLSNPYTLSLFIEDYRYDSKIQTNLSNLNLSHLYDNLLPTRFDAHQKRGSLRLKTWPQLKGKLQRLAYEMIVDGSGTSVNLSWAQRRVGKRALKDGFDLDVLSRDHTLLQFYHPSLLHYFAATNISRDLNQDHAILSAVRALWMILIWFSAPVGVLLLAAGMEKTHGRLYRHLGDKVIQHVDKLDRGLSTLKKLAKQTDLADGLIPLLAEQLDHGKGHWAVLVSLVKLGTPGIRIVEHLLATNDSHTQLIASYALSRIGHESVVPTLTKLLSDQDWGVRLSAAKGLGEVANSSVIPLLEKALEDFPTDLLGVGLQSMVQTEIIDAINKINQKEGIHSDSYQVRSYLDTYLEWIHRRSDRQ